MYKPWSSTTEVPTPPLDRPVWVHLDRLYGPPDESAAGVVDPAPDGWLQVNTQVPGLLKRWKRSTDGRWFGLVDFSVRDAYGAVQVRHERAAVRAAALSLRPVEPRR